MQEHAESRSAPADRDDDLGHKTASMFQRYVIIAEEELRVALRRTQQFLKERAQKEE